MLRANSPGSVIRYSLWSAGLTVAAAAAFARPSGSFRSLFDFCASARSFIWVLSKRALDTLRGLSAASAPPCVLEVLRPAWNRELLRLYGDPSGMLPASIGGTRMSRISLARARLLARFAAPVLLASALG